MSTLSRSQDSEVPPRDDRDVRTGHSTDTEVENTKILFYNKTFNRSKRNNKKVIILTTRKVERSRSTFCFQGGSK